LLIKKDFDIWQQTAMEEKKKMQTIATTWSKRHIGGVVTVNGAMHGWIPKIPQTSTRKSHHSTKRDDNSMEWYIGEKQNASKKPAH